ncbi:hypothetical protein BJ546DRAFT_950002 [Cryomyces antarcticus]
MHELTRLPMERTRFRESTGLTASGASRARKLRWHEQGIRSGPGSGSGRRCRKTCVHPQARWFVMPSSGTSPHYSLTSSTRKGRNRPTSVPVGRCGERGGTYVSAVEGLEVEGGGCGACKILSAACHGVDSICTFLAVWSLRSSPPLCDSLATRFGCAALPRRSSVVEVDPTGQCGACRIVSVSCRMTTSNGEDDGDDRPGVLGRSTADPPTNPQSPQHTVRSPERSVLCPHIMRETHAPRADVTMKSGLERVGLCSRRVGRSTGVRSTRGNRKYSDETNDEEEQCTCLSNRGPAMSMQHSSRLEKYPAGRTLTCKRCRAKPHYRVKSTQQHEVAGAPLNHAILHLRGRDCILNLRYNFLATDREREVDTLDSMV